MSAQSNLEYYDVVVIGGGMVGATLGCCLGGSDLRVAVIESSLPIPFLPEQEHDLRVSALSIASRKIMETVGAWKGIASRRLCPYQRMRVWEKEGDTEFSSGEINQSELGYIAENRITQLAVTERLKDFENIDFICPARTKRIDYGVHQSLVELDDGRLLATRLLVAADGGHSRVRQAVGIGVTSWDYRQQALVLSVETAYGQQNITWQRFVPTGPQAFLPLSGARGSVVWYNTPDEVRRLKDLPDVELLTEMKTAFPRCLGDITHIIERGSFPLKRQHALDYVKSGIALIGDAAHMIHPLAGQGVNIGLLDAAALAQVVVEAKNVGQDFGSLAVLKRYEKIRRRENLVMMTTMDLFYRVFSSRIPPVRLVRNLGLGLAQRLTPAKNRVMRYAMGLEGDLPKLARGKPIIL